MSTMYMCVYIALYHCYLSIVFHTVGELCVIENQWKTPLDATPKRYYSDNLIIYYSYIYYS